MGRQTTPEAREGISRFARFRAGGTGQRLFTWPTGHPSQATGFCACDGPLHEALGFYLKATLLHIVLQLPFSTLSVRILRGMGARIGQHVFISAGAWIDPSFLDLLTIEDHVLIGVGARIAMHEYRPDAFVAGRVIIRRGAVIGGFALIGPGVEIGEGATVAAGAAVGRDVPPGATAIGNPARVVRRRS